MNASRNFCSFSNDISPTAVAFFWGYPSHLAFGKYLSWFSFEAMQTEVDSAVRQCYKLSQRPQKSLLHRPWYTYVNILYIYTYIYIFYVIIYTYMYVLLLCLCVFFCMTWIGGTWKPKSTNDSGQWEVAKTEGDEVGCFFKFLGRFTEAGGRESWVMIQFFIIYHFHFSMVCIMLSSWYHLNTGYLA